ncbi:MAG: MtrB/PioB family outer membrane beta-barrel protein [Nitrospirae bacterium]|nr:MtrB/PioB family outer membrane beta-barrel protein [Nitrospirota bacterium]
MKNLLYILLIVSIVCVAAPVMGGETPADYSGAEAGADDAAAVAEEDGSASLDEAAAWEEEVAELPPMHFNLEPEFRTWLGGRVVDVNGANRAMEFGWPHSSVTGGFKLHYSPLPHRFDAELDMKNQYDYQTEFAYAYKDAVKLSYIGLGLWHNLDHLKPVTAATYFELGGDDIYHATVHDNRLHLRLKWPDRAYHVFGEFRQFTKEGSVQKRFYARNPGNTGSAKYGQTRSIDWITRQYRAGANGHFGPVELEYAHRIKTFDSHKDTTLFDRYRVGATTYTAEHAFMPEITTSEDAVKAHTDLTGRIVGSATFVNGGKENNISDAKVDFRRAYTDLTLMPFEHVTVALRYRYLELDTETPDFIFEPNYPGAPAVKNRPTKNAVDSRTNKAEATVRYTPCNWFGMKVEYLFEKKERYKEVVWYTDPTIPGILPIPSEENQHTVKVGVDVRPSRSLKAKGAVQCLYNSDPAYAVRPKSQYSGRFDIDWTPSTSVAADLYYRITRAENNNAEMRLSRDNVGALVSWTPAERLSLNASYDYTRYKKAQEMEFNLPPFAAPTEDHVTNRDTSHMYLLGADYEFAFPLSLNGEFHQSWSRGRFRTSVANAGVSSSYIGPLTNLKVRETGGGVTAKYAFRNGWGAEASYNLNNYQDMQDQPQDGDQDGTAQAVLVLLTRNW